MKANAVKGEVAFEVEGASYRMVLDFNALCLLEDDLPGLMDGNAEIKTPKAIRSVFWAGLVRHHPEIDLQDAGDLIHTLGLVRAGELVGEAFAASFGGEEKTAPPRTARSCSGAGQKA